MARSPGIPDELKPEVLRRAAAGQSNRTIAAWLEAEHGIKVAHTTIGRLVKTAGIKSAKADEPEPPPQEYVKRDPPRRPPAKPKPGVQSHAICGGKTRDGGRCHHHAGLRTKHPGVGKCWMHGGNVPGAPKGNKNHLTTGAREQLFRKTLDEAECEALPDLMTESVAVLVAEDVALLKIRYARMMARLQVLQARGELDGQMVDIQQTDQAFVGDRRQTGDDGEPDAGKRVSTWRSKVKRSLQEQIRIQEQAMTQINTRLTAGLRLLYLIRKEAGGGEEDLLGDLRALLGGGE